MTRGSLLILAFALLASPATQACSVCFGESDSQMAQGMNMGILVLLLVITSVLAGVGSFFVYLARRGSQLAQPQGHPAPSDFPQTTTNA